MGIRVTDNIFTINFFFTVNNDTCRLSVLHNYLCNFGIIPDLTVIITDNLVNGKTHFMASLLGNTCTAFNITVKYTQIIKEVKL